MADVPASAAGAPALPLVERGLLEGETSRGGWRPAISGLHPPVPVSGHHTCPGGRRKPALHTCPGGWGASRIHHTCRGRVGASCAHHTCVGAARRGLPGPWWLLRTRTCTTHQQDPSAGRRG